jgi:hypothetical protein
MKKFSLLFFCFVVSHAIYSQQMSTAMDTKFNYGGEGFLIIE